MKIIRYLIIILSLCVGHNAHANDIKIYQDLAKRLTIFPVLIVSAEGDVKTMNVTAEGYLGVEGVSILDSESQSYKLPSFATTIPFPELPGTYLIHYFINGQHIAHSAYFSKNVITLSNPIPISNPGKLLATYGGEVASLNSNGDIVNDVARIKEGKLVVGRNKKTALNKSIRYLGAVKHPQTGHGGIALKSLETTTRNSVLELYFANNEPIFVKYNPALQILAADGKKIVTGLFSKCESATKYPKGLCTPYLFVNDIPSKSKILANNDLTNITKSTPNVTFGTDRFLDDETDFKIVEDRLLVREYRGLKQRLLDFDLKIPSKPKFIVEQSEATNFQFLNISWTNDGPITAILKKGFLGNQALLYRDMDGSVKQAYQTADAPEIKTLELETRTVDHLYNTEKLVPFIMVGKPMNVGGRICQGPTVIEVYGSNRIANRPYNLLGYVPELFNKNGLYISASIRGSGGYGHQWASGGSFENSANQVEDLTNFIKWFSEKGCDDITLLGFSHGGIVSLNAAINLPHKVKNVIAIGSPLDIKQEYEVENKNASALLPRGKSDVQDIHFAAISPKQNLAGKDKVQDLNITLITGGLDTVVTTDKDKEFMELARSKGANVNHINRPKAGHYKVRSREDWAFLYSIIGNTIKNGSQSSKDN